MSLLCEDLWLGSWSTEGMSDEEARQFLASLTPEQRRRILVETLKPSKCRQFLGEGGGDTPIQFK